MGYLLKTVETIRVASEDEAKATIEEAKKSNKYTLAKYSSEYKCSKAKGEIVDEWYRVTLTKHFNDEKEPDCYVKVTYDVNNGFFPGNSGNYEEDEE